MSRLEAPRRLSRCRAVVRAATVALVAVGLLAACGVPLDREPQALSRDNVPYDLLEQATTTTSSTTTLAVPTVDVPVYFVLNGRLVEVQRPVTQTPSVNKAVSALLRGPGDDEEGAGLRTALSPDLEVEVGRVEQGVVTIDLGAEFSKLPREEQPLVLAQLVWTATGITGVTAARFTLDGKDIDALLPDASLAPGPVGREAYAAIGPNAPPPSPSP